MDFWNRARSFAEEAAKRSQELTMEAAKKSQELTAEAARRSQEFSIGSSKLADIVSETAKRSKEIAVEASKRADQIKLEAIKRADQIKSLAESSGALSVTESIERTQKESDAYLERFGVTDELREFVKEINITTFQDFPMPDDSDMSNVPTVSNVRQDLTEFQEKHAKLVLSSVKEISKLRYELCPRIMKERKFWRIYFILVNSHVAPYEKQYMEDAKQKASEEAKHEKIEETPNAGVASKAEAKELKHQNKKSSSSAEQDLDVFLLGDLGDSDDGGDDGDDGLDDDFDKMVDSSDDDKEKS
ncbi:uncharacterized protein LOC116215538 [Punica granatum]|uniref:Uncharacterized protein n=2 Tax=Punica granatum TaxID=22663 RepID=A0A2I0HIB6_PUNGR|nr:uncharacterized protein LOC116215538 [Punica granatum]PKI31449.1 hypothetical protein CRG98_048162 [Punica granatum]